jgi:hypothetical protein
MKKGENSRKDNFFETSLNHSRDADSELPCDVIQFFHIFDNNQECLQIFCVDEQNLRELFTKLKAFSAKHYRIGNSNVSVLFSKTAYARIYELFLENQVQSPTTCPCDVDWAISV